MNEKQTPMICKNTLTLQGDDADQNQSGRIFAEAGCKPVNGITNFSEPNLLWGHGGEGGIRILTTLYNPYISIGYKHMMLQKMSIWVVERGYWSVWWTLFEDINNHCTWQISWEFPHLLNYFSIKKIINLEEFLNWNQLDYILLNWPPV